MTPANRRLSPDLLSVLLLIFLCWLFYWRLLTPNPLNQQSLIEGDFSGQFVSFAHYQAVRLGGGEIPLWNPYNLGGHPFLADTQAAVFYPPRLVTVALLNLTGGSTPTRMYDALQKEMVAHALLASLLMYALIRRLTLGQPGSFLGGLVGGLSFAYSGYLTGYPQLQLAVMESGIWLPLSMLGIHEATRNERTGWRWFGLAGLALALSLLAGHPQTALFFMVCSAAYLAYRVVSEGRPWPVLIIGLAVIGLVGVGLAAVQLLPGWEYLGLTTRAGLGFDALGNGFPFYDVLQMVFPGFLSLWSPLYFGLAGLALAFYAVFRRLPGSLFWLAVALFALALSFGRGTVLYDLFYNLIPGFSLFRGQERAAYLVAVSASILAGLGAAAIFQAAPPRRYVVIVWGAVGFISVVAAVLFLHWLATPDADSKRLALAAFSLFVAVPLAALLTTANGQGIGWRSAALLGLVVFELFSFGRTNPNLESKPAGDRLQLPPLVKRLQDDTSGPFRVDGARGLRENYGTLYGVMDIQGTSPLRLASIDRLLKLPNQGRAWEALAVRYVLTDRTALAVPGQVVASGSDPLGPVNMIRLGSPRPFARLVYKTWIEADDGAALGYFSDPSFQSASTVILPADPGVKLPASAPGGARVEVTRFAPELILLRASTPTDAILDIALPYYPGWTATLDGQPATLLRADTALTALAVPSGDHTLQLAYQPRSFAIGGLISLVTLVLVILGGLSGLAQLLIRTRRAASTPAS